MSTDSFKRDCIRSIDSDLITSTRPTKNRPNIIRSLPIWRSASSVCIRPVKTYWYPSFNRSLVNDAMHRNDITIAEEVWADGVTLTQLVKFKPCHSSNRLANLRKNSGFLSPLTAAWPSQLFYTLCLELHTVHHLNIRVRNPAAASCSGL